VRSDRHQDLGGLIRGAITLTLVGAALGVAYNATGRASSPQWGLEWIASDRFADLPTLEAADTKAQDPSPGSFRTNVSDPMAIGAAPQATANVPQVPDLDRPMQIQLDAAKQFFDADAAWFVDARDQEECEAARIAGAICLPYDEVSDHPERPTSLGVDARPIIAYCGGGLCEISLSVAWELVSRGHSKVLVYMGGFALWEESGYPVERRSSGAAGNR